MSPCLLRFALLLPSVITGIATGCSRHDAASAGLAAPAARASCDTEARQLTESAALYSAPETAPVAILAAGRFVYRCEERGDWLAVMYPATGEKVDCAERRTQRACELGWIRKDTHMAIFG